jgi:multiple sugar transport system permease protein
MNNKKEALLARKSFKETINEIKLNKVAYFFLLPFMMVFITFTVLPVVTALGYSFTSFNILQSAKFIGWQNYINLLTSDSLFFIAVKNTLFFAAITGPLSYFLALLLAWFINEMSNTLRAFLTLLFYAPALANVFIVWKYLFAGDSYGWLNGKLIQFGIISAPIQWMTDTKYMITTIIIVILWSSLGAGFLTFIAGLKNVDKTLYEAGAVDGIRNRWQELWFITLPYMKPQLMIGAVLSITASFSIGGIIDGLVGVPSTDYVAWTIMNHLNDYGSVRFEMGYACAISTILFIIMLLSNKIVQKLVSKVGE